MTSVQPATLSAEWNKQPTFYSRKPFLNPYLPSIYSSREFSRHDMNEIMHNQIWLFGKYSLYSVKCGIMQVCLPATLSCHREIRQKLGMILFCSLNFMYFDHKILAPKNFSEINSSLNIHKSGCWRQFFSYSWEEGNNSGGLRRCDPAHNYPSPHLSFIRINRP